MTGTSKNNEPQDISDEYWVPASVACNLLGTSPSKWFQSVASAESDIAQGRPAAPQPVVRKHRFTRWRLGDIRRYQAELIEHAKGDQAEADMRARLHSARLARWDSVRAAKKASEGQHEPGL